MFTEGRPTRMWQCPGDHGCSKGTKCRGRRGCRTRMFQCRRRQDVESRRARSDGPGTAGYVSPGPEATGRQEALCKGFPGSVSISRKSARRYCVGVRTRADEFFEVKRKKLLWTSYLSQWFVYLTACQLPLPPSLSSKTRSSFPRRILTDRISPDHASDGK